MVVKEEAPRFLNSRLPLTTSGPCLGEEVLSDSLSSAGPDIV